MLENKLLVVQKLFQCEGCDSNWIHEELSKFHDCIKLRQTLEIYEQRAIRKTSGQWQFAASKE